MKNPFQIRIQKHLSDRSKVSSEQIRQQFEASKRYRGMKSSKSKSKGDEETDEGNRLPKTTVKSSAPDSVHRQFEFSPVVEPTEAGSSVDGRYPSPPIRNLPGRQAGLDKLSEFELTGSTDAEAPLPDADADAPDLGRFT